MRHITVKIVAACPEGRLKWVSGTMPSTRCKGVSVGIKAIGRNWSKNTTRFMNCTTVDMTTKLLIPMRSILLLNFMTTNVAMSIAYMALLPRKVM
jgi:hypothetical protein